MPFKPILSPFLAVLRQLQAYPLGHMRSPHHDVFHYFGAEKWLYKNTVLLLSVICHHTIYM